MVEFEFLKSLVIIFGLSAIAVFILGKLRVPSVIGFLVAGVLLGPYGLELIEDVHIVEILAEIGIVLLLFTIGLEFSLKNLLALKKTIFIGGFVQVLITSSIVFLLAAGYIGLNTNTSIILGGLIAFSSTAIVLKLLADRGEIDSPHGRVSMGILIFQDFCVVIFILLVPMLAGTHQGAMAIFLVLAKAVVIIAVVIFAARWIVPKALHQIVHTRMRELFVISIIFICLGTAYMTYKLGLSLALGAFIAGLIISESEYSYQAISDILPFKDSFNGLFFISVGMLMDIHFFVSHFAVLLLIVAGIIILKTMTATIAAFFTGSNMRVSLHSGLVLSQIGEFSFVIAVSALAAGLITENIYQFFLSSAIITMIFTPLLMYVSPSVSMWVASRKMLHRVQAMREHVKASPSQDVKKDHVIIVGYGINGRNLSLVLKELEVPYIILELNSSTVTKLSEQGEPVLYGDGTSQEILHKLGIEKAKTIVIAITDPSATRKIAITVRKMNQNIHIVVRTRYIAEVEDLIELGADEVIPAEFETSIEIFSRVLRFYHMPKTLIDQYSEKFRKGNYELFIGGKTPKRLFHDTLALMPNTDYESYVVGSNSPLIDSSYESLEIQKKTGAHLIAVRRGTNLIKAPEPEFVFLEGDIVLMIGDNPSLEKAGKFFC